MLSEAFKSLEDSVLQVAEGSEGEAGEKAIELMNEAAHICRVSMEEKWGWVHYFKTIYLDSAVRQLDS